MRLIAGLSFLFFVSSAFASDVCKGAVEAKVGACAPQVSSLENVSQKLLNKSVTANDLRGKVVFLHFWATWCKPCVEELPELEKLFAKIKDNKNIVFLAVSIDTEGKPALDRFFERLFANKYPKFDILLDQKKLTANRFDAIKVPETFIIDKTGKITDKIVGINNWDSSIVENYLNLLSQQ
ncbi:MAG TPA: TlpA disulfide reductase family protein [Oligoflexia bacterium]|nr:TlpA disulfide reductase family protein [Oligoflexia bacterium]